MELNEPAKVPQVLCQRGISEWKSSGEAKVSLQGLESLLSGMTEPEIMFTVEPMTVWRVFTGLHRT